MRRIAPFLVLLGCDAGAPGPTGPRPDQIAQAEIHEATLRAQHELDAVAKAVLERYKLDPQSVPDAQLLEHEPTILVDRDLERDPERGSIGAQLTADALPVGKFALRSVAEMQADADRTHDTVHSIFLYRLQIEGNRAKFWVGVHVKIPDVPEGSGTCCCSAQQIYVKRAGVWTYAETTDSICS
ncbi:MAG TPA: hypothetical protein VL326_37320 [Kofleriaceae bacterium]|nr:hypothetical protein [Kofleriaceae bacterium]